MTLPYLPDDCIHHILKYLQGYYSTLYNCTLVNRFWCRATIPLLYADPFTPSNKYIISNKNIIITFILCFNRAEILQLRNLINLISVNNIEINDEHKVLFEYQNYLKNYNYYDINDIIIKWIKHIASTQFPNENILENICSIFHQSILNHCINIKQFTTNFNTFINSDPNFNIPTLNLTQLNSLRLDDLVSLNQGNGREFLSNIAIDCLNLKELRVSLVEKDVGTEELCMIIQNQNNLEKFNLSKCLLNNNIFSSLEFQKHSLVSIEFSRVDFSNITFNNLINLYNLNYLRFFGCEGEIPSIQYEVLNFASFNLTRLEFQLNTWKEDIIPTIIKYLGHSLRSLSINEKIITIPIIENISIYCLNLITLEMRLFYFKNFDLSIFPYFKNLGIRKLCIDSFLNNESKMSIISLANNLSTNVKEIYIMSNSSNKNIINGKSSYLKTFLENCHNYLEIIGLHYNLPEPEYQKIILNYIQKSNNSLKILKIVGPKEILNELNVHEQVLLDAIRKRGVKTLFDYIRDVHYSRLY
ncbi:hypothetical protein RclHR1_00100004 [Rhizophagus clarus]|uniref:F-box domain-containing protein n=1 Tax=Rhizophagus clarus TaxID=94130 RepID=A0A2Z6Q0C1_9GLOM|nr:hypothetical protein RclHR1_00100004 [Rhizophagus clarus]GES75680.1 hypothetical protein GLOIN_2v1774869 [Rhizophagus clarus]